MSIKIYGSSDDLLEIESDISEEFNFYPDEGTPALLAFSDGTLLSVVYDDNGIWRITRIVRGAATFEKGEGDVEADTMDVVTLSGVDFKWAVLCEDASKSMVKT